MNNNRIGFIGLGKLGLPCAAALSVTAGVKVNGFDKDIRVKDYIKESKIPYQEALCEDYLAKAELEFFENLSDFLDATDTVFVAVQTPHEPQFEGSTPVPNQTRDFDYSYLVSVAEGIRDFLQKNPKKWLTVVVISTVLPGTMRNVVIPAFGNTINQVKFCYNPFFIAMGTTIPDYLNPEFVLIGEREAGDSDELISIYRAVHNAPVRKMKIESAELTKVAYNTFIGFKIVFANAISEIVQRRGGDSDEVTSALASAHSRLLSPKYLKAGMADGGGCHPRDQIAMSWLAKEAELSTDIFGYLARARDAQTQKQASDLIHVAEETGLPICILGTAYKADVNLTIGSPSLLLGEFLRAKGVEFTRWDPFVDTDKPVPNEAMVYFVATNHSQFRSFEFAPGSVVVDPWGDVVAEQQGVEVIRPGRS